jgi:hypothetical protein
VLGEETTTKQRFKTTKAYFTLLNLLHQSGYVTIDDLSRQQSMLCSFLMGVQGLTGNDNEDELADRTRLTVGYRAARLRFMSRGYFAGNGPGIMVVSKYLKIGYSEMLYIRVKIGPTKTNKLLADHGILVEDGRPSPLEKDSKCPGPPAAPGIEAEECKATVSDCYSRRYATIVGGLHSGNVFFGTIVCNVCHRKMERRELAILKELESKGNITKSQQTRLNVLNDRVVAHNQGDKVYRTKQARLSMEVFPRPDARRI